MILAAVILGFAIPCSWWVAALAFAKFVLQRDLRVDGVAPHGADDTLGNARGAAGNIAPLFIEVR